MITAIYTFGNGMRAFLIEIFLNVSQAMIPLPGYGSSREITGSGSTRIRCAAIRTVNYNLVMRCVYSKRNCLILDIDTDIRPVRESWLEQHCGSEKHLVPTHSP